MHKKTQGKKGIQEKTQQVSLIHQFVQKTQCTFYQNLFLYDQFTLNTFHYNNDRTTH